MSTDSGKRVTRAAAGICLLLAWPLLAHAASSPVPDAVTVDGGRYYGPLAGGKLQGRGRIEWDNGARYEGGFANGLYSGQGRMQFASGDVYDGEFRDGQMEGRGRMRTLDGSVYVGEFRNDYYNGQGRHETSGGFIYEGMFENGYFQGQGRLDGQGSKYKGEFKHGLYWGQGEITHEDGSKYGGAFVRGVFQGKGRFENAGGEVFDGDFEKNEFTGTGTLTRKDGSRYEGSFLKWLFHGRGKYVDAQGNVYEGRFANGELDGAGKLALKDGGLYEGQFKHWRFHGQGVLRLPNGDVYRGAFAHGVYEGDGTLTYAKPRPDGRTQERGKWRYGLLEDEKGRRRAQIFTETALYSERGLLDKALASLTPRSPGKINMYLLAVAGDYSQEVFRREVEFVRDQFTREFDAAGHALALINSRSTVAVAPMATITSIRESLTAMAGRMDKEQDILFLFLTSHGSREHELTLSQNNMSLRNLSASELGRLLRESGIRWKVVVVSACYSGGFIDAVRDSNTLVMTAARHDRQSFGCADENDFTYFGRALFKEALPQSSSFQDAFRRAEALIKEWELKDQKATGKADAGNLSLPQIYNPTPIDRHLQRWWVQMAKERTESRR